jgi:hypothetical protein
MGFSTNLLAALNLARQEYIRQWYFTLLPSSVVPFMPEDAWFPYTFMGALKKSVSVTDIQINSTDYLSHIKVKPAHKRLLLCWLGKNEPGYCKTFFILFLAVSLMFIFLGLFFFFS